MNNLNNQKEETLREWKKNKKKIIFFLVKFGAVTGEKKNQERKEIKV